MRKIVYMIAVLSQLISCGPPDYWTFYAVFGQSNAKGAALTAGASETWRSFSGAPLTNLKSPQNDWLMCADSPPDVDTPWAAGAPRLVNFGAWLTFGRVLVDYNRKIAIINMAFGGCGADCWINGVVDRYAQSLAYMQAEFDAFPLPGEKRWGGIFQITGETDAQNLATANALGPNIALMQSWYRTDLGAPDLSLIVYQLHIGIARTFATQARASVAAMVLDEKAAGRKAAIANIDDIVAWHTGDSIHLNALAAETLGQRGAVAEVGFSGQ